MESILDYRFLKEVYENIYENMEFFYVFNQCIEEARAPWEPTKKAYIANPSPDVLDKYEQDPFKYIQTPNGPKKYRKAPPQQGFQGALLHGDNNPKIAKGAAKGYLSLILNLSPAEESGFNLCACRTSGCALACLHLSGSPVFQKVKMQSRLKNTFYLVKQREKFVDQLISEIQLAKQYAQDTGQKLAIRLNGTSDLAWESPTFGKNGKSIMELFPDVQFYDYSKIPGRVKQFTDGKMPTNYHLTFSYSEKPSSKKNSIEALRSGMNVAVVFGPGKAGVMEKLALPSTWEGYQVIDGDESDLRFIDPRAKNGYGVVVGLRAKADAAWDYDAITPNHLNAIDELFAKSGIKTPLARSGFSPEAKRAIESDEMLLSKIIDILRQESHKKERGTGFVVQPEDASVDPRVHPENRNYVLQGIEKKLIRAFNGLDKRETYRKMRQDFFAKHGDLYKDYLKKIQDYCAQNPEECQGTFDKMPLAKPNNPLAQQGIGISPQTLQQIGIIRKQ